MNLSKLIKSSGKYDLTIFSAESIDRVEKSVFEKNGKQFIKCLKREKDIQAKPEEIVRQLMLDKLIKNLNYPKNRIDVEVKITFGRDTKKRADIVVYREDGETPYIMVEVKKPEVKDGLEQLKSYANATGAPLLILADGKEQKNILRTDPNLFESLIDIPKFNETVEDVRNKKITYKDLDEVRNLKSLILDLENAVLANSGVNSFEEVFKLVYAKLFDELETPRGSNREFRVIAGATNKENLNHIKKLFEKAKREWPDIFKDKDDIEIPENAIISAVSLLQDKRLFGSNLRVIDNAFEYLITKDSKGEKGQYFTPRNVINMCIDMLNIQSKDYVLDSASGSCGFLLHAMQYVWDNEITEENFGDDYKSKRKTYANTKLFGIDFDPRAVKIGKAMMLIAGDGKTNVCYANSIDSSIWGEEIKSKFKPLLRKSGDIDNNILNEKKYREFDFDVVITNPPFAGDVKGQVLNNYDLGFKWKDGEKTSKHADKISRHILFIERNLNFLQSGGRMAIVLPQGVFNNSGRDGVGLEPETRNFIMQNARILAVVGLDNNTFRPHAGIKTSVLFVQKWDEKINPKIDDYPIFMAVSENSGKNNSGDEIYEIDKNGERKLDEHGHLKQKHDLDDIAFAFEKWGKENGLSFWR